VNDRFSPAAAGSLPDGDGRRQAASRAQSQPLPSAETEDWRYSPVGELDLGGLGPSLGPPPGATAPDLIEDVVVGDRAATVVVLDGWVVDIRIEAGWADKGLEIRVDHGRRPSLPDAPLTVFDQLHQAFSPAAVHIRAGVGLTVREPIVVVNHHASTGTASFPHLLIECDEAADIAVVERTTSIAGHGLSVPVAELAIGQAARLRYLSIQEHDRSHWQIGRQVSSVAGQATLVGGLAVFGGSYARLRTDSRLTGRGASAELVAVYYGDGDQIHDFRTFQHHDARDTRSDLLFKGSQDDSSRSIYSGMIHIHPDGAGSNAFQTNRNIKLSPDAWAWSVPNLEIENNDVHCSHASTVSPVDEDQQFYLQSRGVPPVAADRLIVAGFFDEAIDRLPVAAARDEVRRLVADKLDRREAS
jgi:Fe-S cluster assembly protein SufD